jgi:hypothetical protein
MSIRFPKMHIAQSTANRILNIADGLPAVAPIPIPAPVMPEIDDQGEALTAQLQTPLAPTELPGGTDGAVVEAALNGENLVSPALAPELGVTV